MKPKNNLKKEQKKPRKKAYASFEMMQTENLSWTSLMITLLYLKPQEIERRTKIVHFSYLAENKTFLSAPKTKKDFKGE